MSDFMNQELVDEIEYTKELLANSGFFNREDIIEILEEQFIEEDIDFPILKYLLVRRITLTLKYWKMPLLN